MSAERCGCSALATVRYALVTKATGEVIDHGPQFFGCASTVCPKRRRASFAAAHRAALFVAATDVRIVKLDPPADARSA